MKVFLAFSFRDEDKPLVAEIARLLRSHSIQMVSGEDLGGEELTPAVKQRIEASDGLIALLTRRDPFLKGGWASHDWVRDELGHAREKKKHTIALVEDGVDVGGMSQPHEFIPLDKSQPEKALLQLARTLGAWEWRGWWRPTLRIAAISLALLLAAAGGWWQVASTEVAQAIARSEPLLRAGSYSAALPNLETACARRLVGRPACFARDKAALGAMLETGGDQIEIERFAQQLDAINAAHPDEDPDLLLFGGALAMRERDPARQADQARGAEQAWQRAIALRGGHFPEAYFYQGDRMLRASDFAAAQALFDKALADAPNAPHIRSARAYARYRRGNLAGAAADLRQSAADGLISARVDLAPLLWRADRYGEAAEQLDEALRQLKERPAGRNLLPWSFDLAAGGQVNLRAQNEKICYARLARQATAILQGANVQPDRTDCGADGSHIARAVADALTGAKTTGMTAAFAQRLRENGTSLGEQQ